MNQFDTPTEVSDNSERVVKFVAKMIRDEYTNELAHVDPRAEWDALLDQDRWETFVWALRYIAPIIDDMIVAIGREIQSHETRRDAELDLIIDLFRLVGFVAEGGRPAWRKAMGPLR